MSFTPHGKGPTRGRAAPDKQLSKLARFLLVWLLSEETALSSSPAGKLDLKNRGIPWDLSKAAAELGVATASAARTLAALEDRRLIACWATGESRGRRISHIKLSATAIEVATFQRDYGKSASQAARQNASAYRNWLEEKELEAWEAS
jgi:hypothetical protein